MKLVNYKYIFSETFEKFLSFAVTFKLKTEFFIPCRGHFT